jgi:hypothetical protein
MDQTVQAQGEYSLLDYLFVLLRRKYLIGAVVLAAVAATLLFSLLTPAQYKSVGMVKRGSRYVLLESDVILNGVIEDLRSKEKLSAFESLFAKEGKSPPEGIAGVISSSHIGGGVVQVMVILKDRELCQALCESLVDRVIAYGNEKMDEREALIREQLVLNKGHLEQVGQNLRIYGDRLEHLRKAGVPQPESIYETQDMIVNLQLNEINLLNRESQLKNMLLEEKRFVLLKKPQMPRKPLKPRIRMNVLISLVISLFAAIGLAVFLEALQNYRRK